MVVVEINPKTDIKRRSKVKSNVDNRTMRVISLICSYSVRHRIQGMRGRRASHFRVKSDYNSIWCLCSCAVCILTTAVAYSCRGAYAAVG